MGGDDTHIRPFVESAEQRRLQVARTSRLFTAATFLQGELELDEEGGWFLRPLLPTEVDTLRGPCHCRCQDWTLLRLLLPPYELEKDQSSRLETLVSHTTFCDVVVLGVGDGIGEASSSTKKIAISSDWQKLPPGIHSNALISNCVLEPQCRVYRNMLLCDTHVGSHAIVVNCSHVSCSGNVTYGNMQITVGAESGGGRELNVDAESNMIDICNGLGISHEDSSRMASLPLNRPPPCDKNIIGAYSLVRDTATIRDLYMAPHSIVSAATSVVHAVLLCEAMIGNGCSVSNVLMQWNSTIMDHSTVSNSLLMEHAHSGPHSLVASTVLGPDVHVSAGEVHATILGPNTNAHHQSLLIGVLWPLGRGNVGYGANVGSNHTGRLPDQEAIAAEGTFWGLSTVIKFPVDLSWSPYSIVAAGTTLPPQRIAMPFCLIVEMDGVNQIIPGWVLQHSPYTLSRSDAKFAHRRKAKRHLFYTGWKILRPSVVNMCIAARESLQNVTSPKEVYQTDRAVPGIGMNNLAERARQTGIRAYTECIQRYALRGLLEWMARQPRRTLTMALRSEFSSASIPQSTKSLQIGSKKHPSWPVLPWNEGDGESLWNHQRPILHNEFPNDSDVMSWIIEMLHRLVTLENGYAERVFDCKRRDDIRGSDTIPGYVDSHVAAENDAVIDSVRQDAHKLEIEVSELIGRLGGSPGIGAMSRL